MPREDEEDQLEACSVGDEDGYQPLKLPVVQSKLEDLDANGMIAREAAALEQKDRSDADFEKVKKLYVIYLKLNEIYDEHARVRLGVRRKRHMAGLMAHGAGSSSSSGGSVSSVGSGASGSSSTSFGSFQGLLATEPSDSVAAGASGGGASGSSDTPQSKQKQQTPAATSKTRKQ